MISKQFKAELGRYYEVVDTARQISAMRWCQEHAGRTDTPLAERLVVHHVDVRELVARRDLPGLDMLPDDGLAFFIRAGVVDAGEDHAAVEAAAGFKPR